MSDEGAPGRHAERPPLRVDVFTIFPQMIEQWCGQSIMGRAAGLGRLDIRAHDLRSAATDPHRSVDDSPFGGGAGMLLAPGPVFGAVEAVRPPRPLYLLGPKGQVLDQAMVRELAGLADSPTGGFSLLCARYEGMDQRVADHLVDGELSIGDYVVAGGEVAALVVLEAVTRLVRGVMGNQGSAKEESFGPDDGLLEAPQYTRPAEFRGWVVPEVLVSGDHARIARWRRAQSLAHTLSRRPDLIEAKGGLTATEVALLDELGLRPR